MLPHDDRRVTAAEFAQSCSLSPWHDRTEVELREARGYDSTRVRDDTLMRLEDKK